MNKAEQVRIALRDHFHGGAWAPYAAVGHSTVPDDCWMCQEAAEVAAGALGEGNEE